MRLLAILPLLLILAACDSGSPAGPSPEPEPDDTFRLTGRYSGVGVPDDARQASVLLIFGDDGVTPGTSSVGLVITILDGPGNSYEEVTGNANFTLGADGAVSFTCDCAADFRGRLAVQGSGTATEDEIDLALTGGVRIENVTLMRR